MSHPVLRRAAIAATAAVAAAGLTAPAALAYDPAPNIVTPLDGYLQLWTPTAGSPLHGTVTATGQAALARNDELAVWINQHATAGQRFRALQDAEYDNTGTAYDQSYTVADGLGSVLGPLYVQGRRSGALPLTSALINSQNGSTGAFVGTGTAKATFSYPRPYLPTDPSTPATPGDAAGCDPSASGANVNASSLTAQRQGKPYADAAGNLAITRVPATVDTTHVFSPNDVALSAAYDAIGICTGGSFPSGHTATAFQAGITLATLLPEVAPQILARASEGGNNRIVLGVHYPLDIVGGRIAGETALATRWSDPTFVAQVLEPARAELRSYLERACGATLQQCIDSQASYANSPYGGLPLPGGSAQVVTDRASAARVYRERLSYGFAPIGSTSLAPSVPPTAQALLTTAFPTLTPAQRTSVLAQTEIASGQPLDQSGSAGGSWQRLDLAAALSAQVRLDADGSVTVLSTGGRAEVVTAATPTPPVATPVRAGVLRCTAAKARRGATTRRVTCVVTDAAAKRVKARLLVGGRVVTRTVRTSDGVGRVGFTVRRHRQALVILTSSGAETVLRRVRT